MRALGSSRTVALSALLSAALVLAAAGTATAFEDGRNRPPNRHFSGPTLDPPSPTPRTPAPWPARPHAAVPAIPATTASAITR